MYGAEAVRPDDEGPRKESGLGRYGLLTTIYLQ